MSDLLASLNPAQQAAVTHDTGPLLIIAGAGTGKTSVITRRIAWLISTGKATTDGILALTFTDKAAGEMEERIDKLLPYGYTDLWVSTFHSFGERILKAHALDIGVPYDFRLLDETEQWLLIRRNLHRFNLNYYRPLGNPTKFIHALVRHFSRAKDEGITPEAYLAYAESARLDMDRERAGKVKRAKDAASKTRGKKKTKEPPDATQEAERVQEVAEAYHVYQQLLLEQTALDFGDLIGYTLRLFRERPDVLAKYRAQFRYILVDEFQDTNSAQYELVKLLAAPENNITVVGDDDQSIYRFRGAAMSNILEFSADYPDVRRVVLTENYRSRQAILDLAHTFIQKNNPNRLEVSLTGLSKRLTAAAPGDAAIAHLAGESAADEEQLVLDAIRALHAANEKMPWSDVAILTRSNDEANRFDAALARAGIPHQSYTSRGLYSKPVILDALAYFRLLDNYHESTALWRVLNFAQWNIPGKDLIELTHHATRLSESLFRTIERGPDITHLAPETLATLHRLLVFVTQHTALAQKLRPTELLVKALNDLGYTSWIEQQGDAKARLDFSYLNQFYRRMQRWEESQAVPSLKEFLATILYEIESGEEGALSIDPESGPDVVRVMTMHAAKGLEFAHVFVVGLVERRFPTTARRDPIELPPSLAREVVQSGDAHLEEERRLFYVAMTRAKESLYFTSAEDYGGVRKKKPSPFLYELGISLAAPVAAAPAHPFAEAAPVDRAEEALQAYLPERFSFTQLKAFETCPFQYRFAHVLKVPVWGRHTFSFGTSMHATLERFFLLLQERRQAVQDSLFGDAASLHEPTLEELLRIYEESWIPEWYQSARQADEYRARGKDILVAFYEKHRGNWPETKYVERGFTLKIGPYTLSGKVDRVDVKGDGVEIIDYKTGRVPSSDADLEKDQLLIYQMAAEVIWKEKPVALTFYYLNENKPMSFIGSPEDIEEMQLKIRRTIDNIRRGSFPPDPDPNKCKFCDFKEICQFRQLD